MKSAHEISRKLKDIKFRHWTIFYKNMTKRIPENCKYFIYQKFLVSNSSSKKEKVEIGLCMIHQDTTNSTKGLYPHLLDICTDCTTCNGFVPKLTREEIKKIFIQEIETKLIKEKKYPEICAMEWVLDKYDDGYPIISKLYIIFYKLRKLFFGIN